MATWVLLQPQLELVAIAVGSRKSSAQALLHKWRVLGLRVSVKTCQRSAPLAP